MALVHSEITEQIIGAAYEVQNELGYGLLERVCQRAMQVELARRGIHAEIEFKIKVKYKGVVVGDYSADLFAAESVIMELKVDEEYHDKHEPQLLNELKATGIKVGLIINFGRNGVEFKRLVF